jgi:GTP-binding protein LepA
MDKIRNFCIIAHIDHGKSTLADRFLEITNTIEKRTMHKQMLDTMDLEQERGITIKLQPVRMDYEGYILNLIDTPGHVDFTFEISRSLAACEGAILVVDATQGIEAQTLANLYLALEQDLEIIPVVNKIDLPAAEPERVKMEISNILGTPAEEILEVSAKEGTNVEKILQKIIAEVPPPNKAGLRVKCNIQDDNEVKALIFDSHFDSYRGIIAFVRVVSGVIKKRDKVYFLSNKREVEVLDCGYFKPGLVSAPELRPGEAGFIVTGLKEASKVKTGDTIYRGANLQTAKMLPGYKVPIAMVFAGIFPEDADDFTPLREALERLSLEDSSLVYEPETSTALGNGYRCGFLGLLHLEIIQERISREFDLNIITTSPSVPYEVTKKDGEELKISSPHLLPEPGEIEEIKEPWIKMEVLSTSEHVGAVLDLITKRRGVFKDMQHPSETRAVISAEMPLANVITDFHDALKSATSGYASMSFEFLEFRAEDLVKMDILLADKIAHAFSHIVHRSEAQNRGSHICKLLKDTLPRKQFVIKIQAAIGSRVIARETLSAMRKDVTAKLYGGDVTRKNKLLKKQKKGKKKMMSMGVGSVEVPKDVFLKVLRRED